MPKTTLAPAARSAKRPPRFSLVPTDAQQAMYAALGKLKGANSGTEVAEIAVCLAAGDANPVIFAAAARGARTLGRQSATRLGQATTAKNGRMTAATAAAASQLLQAAWREAERDESQPASASAGRAAKKNAKPARSLAPSVAIVCGGKLDSNTQADYRAAFAFAARHKLPILYLVGTRLPADKNAALDLRSLYPEFGMPLFTVDAADAIAAYRVATEALHNARQMRGPCVIEALTLALPGAGTATPLQLLAAYMERHGLSPR